MMYRLTCCCLTIALLVAAPARLTAQVTERPVPFDSVGRVPAITEPLAARLRLAPPVWPVLGSFVRAQLFSKSTGGYTLVVSRPDGALDRYDLTGEAAESLRAVVVTALASGRGAGVGEQTSVASDPAGNAFVRNQALLGLFLYGPAAATMVGDASNDAKAALSAELITASGAFALALARRNASPPVTTAQNSLSTDAALHGAGLGEAMVYVAGGSRDGVVHGGALLAGSVTGTILGMRFARQMTDAEAAASGFGADFSTGLALGILGAGGALEHESTARPAAAVASLAMLGGYVLGPSYPRRASYTVTAGDVGAMTTTSIIGIAAAAIPFVGHDRPDARALSASLAGGMIVGAFAGDRWLVRPRDHTTSESTVLLTGAGLGAVMGGGVASLGNASAQPAWGLAVGGAVLGLIATEAAMRPMPGGKRILSGRGDQHSASAAGVDASAAHEASTKRMQITFDPVGAAFAATGRMGTFSVLRVSF
jgi:hypothetical protein